MPAGLFQSLQAERAALRTEGDAILKAVEAAGEWADSQRTRDDEIVAELATLDADLARMERARQHERTAPAQPVEEVTGAATPATAAESAPKLFHSLGEQLRAVKAAAINPARVDERLHKLNDWYSRQAAIQGASESVPADGGFLVQQDFANLLELTHQVGQVGSRVRHVPIGPGSNGYKANLIDETSRANGSRFGGVQVFREGEGVTATAKKPKFRQIDMSLHKLLGFFYATDELLSDATALGATADRAFAEEVLYTIDDEIINGSGAGQMMGILNAGALVSVTKETGQAASSIVAENIFKMYSRMSATNVNNAVWLMNQDCWPQVFGLTLAVGTGGVPMFMEPGRLPDTPNGSLLGRPIVPIEQCATLGTVGDLIFADLDQYLVIEKGGVDRAMSIHVEFLTDQSVFRWTVRNNGQPIPRSAITPAKGSNTQSPFVALQTRS